MSKLSRRKFISGSAIAGFASLAGMGTAMAGNRHAEGENAIEGIEQRLSSFQNRSFNNILYVDVAEGPESVQAAVDEADRKDLNKVVIYGQESEWNKPVYLPSNKIGRAHV